MRRFVIHTAWGNSYGIKVDKTLTELVQELRTCGYLCTPQCYVMFNAIAGIEDEEMIEALCEASKQEKWQ